jgi:hypothetical protein
MFIIFAVVNSNTARGVGRRWRAKGRLSSSILHPYCVHTAHTVWAYQTFNHLKIADFVRGVSHQQGSNHLKNCLASPVILHVELLRLGHSVMLGILAKMLHRIMTVDWRTAGVPEIQRLANM